MSTIQHNLWYRFLSWITFDYENNNVPNGLKCTHTLKLYLIVELLHTFLHYLIFGRTNPEHVQAFCYYCHKLLEVLSSTFHISVYLFVRALLLSSSCCCCWLCSFYGYKDRVETSYKYCKGWEKVPPSNKHILLTTPFCTTHLKHKYTTTTTVNVNVCYSCETTFTPSHNSFMYSPTIQRVYGDISKIM